MSTKCCWSVGLIAVLSIISACTFDVGNKTVGVRSGQFIFIDGNLKTEYRFPFDKVWTASEKALVDMKAVGINRERKMATGTLTGIVGNEKVAILLDYLGKEQTLVSVMVGPIGNNLASRMVHDKITANLLSIAGTK
jgi:hypothetical protein